MKASVLLIAAVMASSVMLAAEDIDAFTYYKFGTGAYFTELAADKATYKPGDTVIGHYRVKNQMGSPIAEGKVRVQIFYNDAKYGEQLFEEYFAAEGINMLDDASIEKEFFYKLPANAPSGDYSIKLYFQSDDYFNLAGLSFLCYGPPGTPAKLTTFKVASDRVSYLAFDNSRITLGGAHYDFHGLTPTFLPGQDIEIRVPIINNGPAKHVTALSATYSWDDSSQTCYMPEKSRVQEYNLSGEQEFIYLLSGLEPGAYQVKIQAHSGQEKAILKLRFTVEGDSARIYYQGLSDFPLRKGEIVKLFATYSYSSGYAGSFPGSIEFLLKDRNGAELFRDSADVAFVSSPAGSATQYTPLQDVSVASLTVSLYDDAGKVMDARTVEYDLSDFEGVERVFEITEFQESGHFTLKYSDSDGRPLSGSAVAYVLNSDSYPVFNSRLDVNGNAEGYADGLTAGSYVLKAVESGSGMSAEKAMTVTETVPPKRTLVFLYVAIAAGVVLIALLFYKRKK